MYPYRSHYNIRAYICISLEGLRACPYMMRQIRCTIGEVVRIKEWEGVYQGHCDSYRDEKSDDWMSRSFIAVSSEGVSKRMLVIEDWRFSCSAAESATYYRD